MVVIAAIASVVVVVVAFSNLDAALLVTDRLKPTFRCITVHDRLGSALPLLYTAIFYFPRNHRTARGSLIVPRRPNIVVLVLYLVELYSVVLYLVVLYLVVLFMVVLYLVVLYLVVLFLVELHSNNLR